MHDVIEVRHPVPFVRAPRRGGPGEWGFAECQTKVGLRRVEPDAVVAHGPCPSAHDPDNVPHVSVIEGRSFIDVTHAVGAADVLRTLCEGAESYRHLDLAATLVAASPLSAIHPGFNGKLTSCGSPHHDFRGDLVPAQRGPSVAETAAARAALASYLDRAVRLCRDRVYIDAGGPSLVPLPGYSYEVTLAPRGIGGVSYVRLAPGDARGYAEALGYPSPDPGRSRLPPAAAGLTQDLALVNQAPASLLSHVQTSVRKGRRDPDSVGAEELAAYEALLRPAYLGSAGMIGPEEVSDTLRILRTAAGFFVEAPVPRGTRTDIHASLVVDARRLIRDIDGWALPRALANDARHDAEDFAFLPDIPGR